MNYSITLRSNNGVPVLEAGRVLLRAAEDGDDTRFSATFSFTDWKDDAYLLLPACAYDGNRMKKIPCRYPPTYRAEDCGVKPVPVIADVPALNPDGSGRIEVTTGDLSVPCVGVFYRHKRQALLVFTEQACGGKNIGFCVENGTFTVQFPAVRSLCYRMCRTNEPSRDTGLAVKAGEAISAALVIKEASCDSVTDFFRFFFENRRCLLSDMPADGRYTEALWHTLEAHMNRDNFSGEYYAETSHKWQCGWVGGGMSSLPLLRHGNEISRARAMQTLDFLTSHVAPSGFFHGIVEGGEIRDDGFGAPHLKGAVLTRKNGDALYFLLRHFDVISPKSTWIESARRCADALARLYERYDSFGQFIHVETGALLFGGTASGASAIGALALAHRYFGDARYLAVAEAAGESYYRDFVAKGLTYGGPGEALCAPDSESAYAMVESTVLLYEITGEEKWLDYAADCLHLFASWVMPYAYRFPADSEFSRLNINTVGSIFANVQNKHSAPGICTASGLAIYKLYKYTGRADYLVLLRDIVRFIPQCVSTEEHPIHSWDREPRMLPPGWICERVNTSDWEGEDCVGGVFYGSCWCETSLLLTYAELVLPEDIRREILEI